MIMVPSAAQIVSPMIVLTSTSSLSLVREASRTSLIGFLFSIFLFLSVGTKGLPYDPAPPASSFRDANGGRSANIRKIHAALNAAARAARGTSRTFRESLASDLPEKKSRSRPRAAPGE
jgi:hypothetical protein